MIYYPREPLMTIFLIATILPLRSILTFTVRPPFSISLSTGRNLEVAISRTLCMWDVWWILWATGWIPSEGIFLLCRHLTTVQNHFSSMCTNIICFFPSSPLYSPKTPRIMFPNESFFALLGDQELKKSTGTVSKIFDWLDVWSYWYMWCDVIHSVF